MTSLNDSSQQLFEPLWLEAEARGAVTNIFVSFDWITSYWQVFGRGKKLWLVTGEGNGSPPAIAPLMITRSAGGLRRLELIGAGIHDYSDFVIHPDQHEVASDIWSQILDSHDDWDVLRLSQLSEHSIALRNAPDEMDGLTTKRSEGEVCPTLHLPDSWDDYIKMIGKNMRYDLGRYSRKIHNDFREVHFRRVATHDELDRALISLFRLHSARWRKRGLPGVLSTPKRRLFQSELTHRLLDRNRLRMFTLDLEGETVAVLLNYFYNGKYFFYIGGFDPDRASYRPGTILFGHAIREAITEGASEFDFLRGREDYKYRLGAQDKPYHSLLITKRTLRSKASAAYVRVEEKLISKARSIAQNRIQKMGDNRRHQTKNCDESTSR